MIKTFTAQETKKTNNSCKACGSFSFFRTLVCRNLRNPIPEYFAYNQCTNCESLNIDTIPVDLAPYYENYYSFAKFPTSGWNLKTFLRRLAFKIPKELRFVPKFFLRDSYDLAYNSLFPLLKHKETRILDVGSGSGRLVYDLVSAGYKNASGIDPYLDKDLIYKNGCVILKKHLAQLEGRWDLIMFHHVLEHMSDPIKILNDASKMLTDDGSILVRIPNVDSYAFRKYLTNWYGLQPPVHLCLPSIKGFKEMLSHSGLKLKKLLGENIQEFWLHSHTYSLNLADCHRFGTRTYLEKISSPKIHPAVSKAENSYFKKLNRHVLKTPDLCDWIVYWVGKK